MTFWSKRQPALTPEEYLERFIAVLNQHGISVYILSEPQPSPKESYWTTELIFNDDRSYHFEFHNSALGAWDETGEPTALRTIAKYREYQQLKGSATDDRQSV